MRDKKRNKEDRMTRQQLLSKQETLINRINFCKNHPWIDGEMAVRNTNEIPNMEIILLETKRELQNWNPLSTKEFKKIAWCAQILK